MGYNTSTKNYVITRLGALDMKIAELERMLALEELDEEERGQILLKPSRAIKRRIEILERERTQLRRRYSYLPTKELNFDLMLRDKKEAVRLEEEYLNSLRVDLSNIAAGMVTGLSVFEKGKLRAKQAEIKSCTTRLSNKRRAMVTFERNRENFVNKMVASRVVKMEVNPTRHAAQTRLQVTDPQREHLPFTDSPDAGFLKLAPSSTEEQLDEGAKAALEDSADLTIPANPANTIEAKLKTLPEAMREAYEQSKVFKGDGSINPSNSYLQAAAKSSAASLLEVLNGPPAEVIVEEDPSTSTEE